MKGECHMEKKAFPISTALKALGIAGSAGIGGYGIGSLGKKKEVNKVEDMFNQYNEEENKKLTEDAFMQGIQFALNGSEGAEKQAFYAEYVDAGYKDEMEKIAKSGVMNKLKKIVKPVVNKAMENKGRVAIGAGVATVGAVAAKKAMEKKSSLIESAFKDELHKLAGPASKLMKEAPDFLAQAKKFILKNKAPLGIGAGAGVAGITAARVALNDNK